MSVLSSPEYVSAGARMVWTGQFPTFLPTFSQTVSDVITNVASFISNHYQLVVEKSDNGTSWGGLKGGNVTLYLRTDIDRGDGELDDGLTDILKNVADAFKNCGYPPISFSLNTYTPVYNAPASNAPASSADSGNRVTINTGTPLETVKQETALKPETKGWFDDILGKVEAGSIGFVVGGIAVVALIVVVLVHSET